MLLQISEPGQTPEPHQRKLAVGIDLGTTNSLVATVRSGTSEVIADEAGAFMLPSVVNYQTDQPPLVGRDAKEKACQDPQNTIISVKRFMGRGLEDVSHLGGQLPYEFVEAGAGMPYLRTAAGDKSPVQVSADILSVLAQRGSSGLGGDIDGAVITVPAYFDEAQRQATKDAAKLAGIPVLRLLNEPTAAAVAYGLDQQDEGVIAIYDLGGGTFDISILRLQAGIFEVLSTGGDTQLGGDDFDRAVAEWVITQSAVKPEQLSQGQLRELMDLACEAKEQLTDADTAPIAFAGWQGAISREIFDDLIDGLVSRTAKVCKRALRDADVTVDDVSNVVMVGGSTRVPLVREKIGELFGREPMVDIDPDQVVALGAAIQADVLVGNKNSDDMLLLDVNPLSLGLETMGGLAEKVITRNATIPVTKAQEFTTYKDGQTAMMIHVLQGERELVKDCRSLAKFELRGIPPMVAGAARIEVRFQIDADGLLNVSAQEMSTGLATSVEVKPSYGLGEQEITRMIRDSVTYAEQDVHARQLQEKLVEANALVDSIETALAEDGKALLSETELKSLKHQVNDLRKVIANPEVSALKRTIDLTSCAADEFAARRMDASVKHALTGKQVDEFETEETLAQSEVGPDA